MVDELRCIVMYLVHLYVLFGSISAATDMLAFGEYKTDRRSMIEKFS